LLAFNDILCASQYSNFSGSKIHALNLQRKHFYFLSIVADKAWKLRTLGALVESMDTPSPLSPHPHYSSNSSNDDETEHNWGDKINTIFRLI